MERQSQNSDQYDSRVMTDEQIETLRKQIAIYAVICEQLLLLHNSLSSCHPLSSGMNLIGGGYFDPTVASSSAHRVSTRYRWTPTSKQLQILEHIYDELGSGTPNPKRVIEIAKELSEHGQITEKNVYNWFQNRRARYKRKQPQTTTTVTSQADDAAVTTEDDERSCGGFESYEHILFPTPDLGIEHLLSEGNLRES